MKKIFQIFILLTLFSCNKEGTKIIKIKSKTFNIPFKYNSKFTGTFSDPKTKNEFIYIGEPITKKMLYFYDVDNGVSIDSISLNEALTKLNEVEAIYVKSKDSILFFGSEKIVLVNQKGNPVLINDLNKYNTDKNGDVYTIKFSSCSNFTSSNHNIIINLDWRYNIFDNNLEKYEIGSFEMIESYYTNFYKKPHIAKLDNYLTDSLKIFYLNENIYKKIYPTPHVFLENFSSIEIEDNFYFYSWYSDLVFKYNKDKMIFMDSFKIESKYTKIGVKPLTINKENPKDIGKVTSKKLQSEGNILRIYYDTYKEIFYLIVLNDFKIKSIT